jgi:hypothetical protein
MQIDRKTIEASLQRKGFVQEVRDHRYYYHELNGRRTGPYTFISTGSSYKTYGVGLLKAMKIQLRLDTLTQVHDLCACPMSREEYIRILHEKGIA